MKRIIISADQQSEQVRINQIYENIRSLVDDIDELSNETFDKLQLRLLYQELLDFIQDNYKFYKK